MKKVNFEVNGYIIEKMYYSIDIPDNVSEKDYKIYIKDHFDKAELEYESDDVMFDHVDRNSIEISDDED